MNTVHRMPMTNCLSSSPLVNKTGDIQQSKKLLQNCDAILITAGAGMGVDSGLPDFRGNEGFWKEFPLLKNESVEFADIASPNLFYTDPYMCWAFYGYRYELYSQADPHAGFHQLLEFAKQKKNGFFVYTSNVDGQFQKAGYPEGKIIECHGSIKYFQCPDSECDQVWSDDEVYFAVDETCLELLSELPECPECGTIARPNVLMFDDPLWNDRLYKEQHKRLNQWLAKLAHNQSNLVVLEIGAGRAIPTVRRTGEDIAKQFQARFIRINPNEQDCISPDISLQMGAGKALERILE